MAKSREYILEDMAVNSIEMQTLSLEFCLNCLIREQSTCLNITYKNVRKSVPPITFFPCCVEAGIRRWIRTVTEHSVYHAFWKVSELVMLSSSSSNGNLSLHASSFRQINIW